MDCKMDFINYLQWLYKFISPVLDQVPCHSAWALPVAFLCDLQWEGEWDASGSGCRLDLQKSHQVLLTPTQSWTVSSMKGKEEPKTKKCASAFWRCLTPSFLAVCLHCNHRARITSSAVRSPLGHII